MIIKIVREKGFINHDSSIEGVSALLYRGELFNDSGQKIATSFGHVLPSVMKRLEKEAIKLDENERNIERRGYSGAL